MTTSIQLSEKPEIEYPDDDGEPMSDNTLQYKWMVLIKENLEIVFGNNPNVFVAGNLLWYPVEGEPTIRTAPDAMVAIGRPKGRRGSYKQWEEGNVPPQVVFETLSPGNRPGELDRKFKFYQQYGALEYYTYEPDNGLFEAWLRSGSRLVKVENVVRFVSPRLGTRFEPGKGPDNLTIFAPDNTRFLTYLELKAQANADHGRAEVEARNAAAERERADSAARRAEKLAARLRELGIDPDSV
jgi:Uma2 family endonuclease